MKGKAQIILTDVRDGKSKVVHEENMFTNALDSVFNGQPFGFNNRAIFSSTIQSSPITSIREALGGILCFPDTLTEDVNHIYEPLDHLPTAYASNDSYSGTNSKRGTFNTLESGVITNGYKFVWDFATSQGNGQISALALTHADGGKNYFEDTRTAVKGGKFNAGDWDSGMGDYGFVLNGNNGQYQILAYNESVVTALFSDGKIRQSKVNPNKVTIVNFIDGSSYDNFMEQWTEVPDTPTYTLTQKVFITNGATYYVVSSISQTSVAWEKFDINCQSLGTGNWTMSGVDLKRTEFGVYTIRDNYLYFPKNDAKAIYKINLSNLADVKEVSFDFENVVWGQRLKMVNLGFAVLTNHGFIDEVGYSNNDNLVLPYCINGVWMTAIGKPGIATYQGIGGANLLLTPYLATINNLGSPVVKTADKTMKIIYQVTEA